MEAKFQALARLFSTPRFFPAIAATMSSHIFTRFFLIARKIFLLQSLARYVQKKIFRIHDAHDEIQPPKIELVAVVNDENAADEQLDKNNARNSELAFDNEMLYGAVLVNFLGLRLITFLAFLVLLFLLIPRNQCPWSSRCTSSIVEPKNSECQIR